MTYNEYKEILFNEYVKKGDHFRNHLVSFLAVNIGIFLLNMLTSPGFPWFLFVVGGWGIGMASHWGGMVVSNKNYREIEELEGLSEDDIETLITLQKARGSFYLHIISNAAVSLYLLTINIITSTAFMWAFIPIIGMGIGLASHWSAYNNKKGKKVVNVKNSIIEEAYELRAVIINYIKEISGKFKHFGAELLPELDRFVETIELLIQKEKDLVRSLNEISEEELVAERRNILDKINKTESEKLKTEYNNLLNDIDRHIETLKKLKEQKELLSIKVSTSINNLKHLKLELIGITSKATIEDNSIISEFENKSSELSLYYKDLMDSYNELFK